jgi:hypothetical protein
MSKPSTRKLRKSEPNLADRVHSAVALLGTTLAHWADQHGYPRTTVHQAVNGTRGGKKSMSIRAELEELCND